MVIYNPIYNDRLGADLMEKRALAILTTSQAVKRYGAHMEMLVNNGLNVKGGVWKNVTPTLEEREIIARLATWQKMRHQCLNMCDTQWILRHCKECLLHIHERVIRYLLPHEKGWEISLATLACYLYMEHLQKWLVFPIILLGKRFQDPYNFIAYEINLQ